MAVLHRWLWAGIDKNRKHNFDPIRITNLICLLVLGFLLLLLPINANSAEGMRQNWLILIHCGCLLPVLWFNQRNWHLHASLLLAATFASYLLFTSLHLGTASHSHYFLLLGLFVLPFIFSDKRSWLIRSCLALYTLLFLWLHFRGPVAGINDDYLLSVKNANAFILVLACVVASHYIHRITLRSWRFQARERHSADDLLDNLLPGDISRQLKHQRRAIAQDYLQTSVLFADLQGFTRLNQEIDRLTVFELLHELYSEFDWLCERWQLEKIKTIGDAYMAVAGAPLTNPRHASQCCGFALAIQRAFAGFVRQRQLDVGLRIGIASGPVVGGVLGRDKYAFDVWGDTVNLAARLQSHGQQGRILVSAATAAAARGICRFSEERALDIAHMGTLSTYWLEEAAIATERFRP